MLRRPYALFVGDAADQLAAKTATGILYWRREWCLGQIRLTGCRASLDLPDITVADAAAMGAATVVIGVANAGGFIAEAWLDPLEAALRAGLDLASGLHEPLIAIPRLRQAAEECGRQLIEVRRPNRTFAVGTGAPRSGNRLLTVGTDCSIGKMYTALAIEREMRMRGMKAEFRATGQTGIFIAGSGVSVDAVIADFISGAVEWLTPAAEPDHWDIVEGQGSLFHPSYAGVSLGLLHGAQPDALVLCHEPTRRHMRGLPDRALPDVAACIRANEEAARLTNPRARCVGLAINTSALSREDGIAYCDMLADSTGLPCVDPLIEGVGHIVDQLT
jgi:uncharacterized NAD-dependent epimerase/dehydratase family protein